MNKPTPIRQPKREPMISMEQARKKVTHPYIVCIVRNEDAVTYTQHRSFKGAALSARNYAKACFLELDTMYIWDIEHPWEPSNADCWTPVAPTNNLQWQRGRVDVPRGARCTHGIESPFCRICDANLK